MQAINTFMQAQATVLGMACTVRNHQRNHQNHSFSVPRLDPTFPIFQFRGGRDCKTTCLIGSRPSHGPHQTQQNTAPAGVASLNSCSQGLCPIRKFHGTTKHGTALRCPIPIPIPIPIAKMTRADGDPRFRSDHELQPAKLYQTLSNYKVPVPGAIVLRKSHGKCSGVRDHRSVYQYQEDLRMHDFSAAYATECRVIPYYRVWASAQRDKGLVLWLLSTK